MRIINQSVEILSVTPNALKLIEQAGRVCYQSEDKITELSSEPFVERLINRGHESVLEHASATVKLITNRAVMAELTRHRLASYSIESTRYCDYNDELTFIPDKQNIDIDEILTMIESKYKQFRKFGIKPEMARTILPNCLKTEIIMTANFREWRHIFKMRINQFAHPMIAELMGLARNQLQSVAPVVFKL